MMRRFVNLVSRRVDSSSLYSLHRLDVADHLFYPSRADAEKAKAEAANKKDGYGWATSWPPAMQRLRQLPAPTMTFQAASEVDAGVGFFELLSPRDSEGRIVFSNKLGSSVLYDADANCVTAMPVIAAQMGCQPITISIARPDGMPTRQLQDLYVMHSGAGTDQDPVCCFGVLRFGDHRPDHIMDTRRKAWCFDPLPAPPLSPSIPICSHAVVDGGRAICLSAQATQAYDKYDPSRPATDSTYFFDTVKREWKHAGDWILPFEGGAQHVPGLGDIWLGFADLGRNLCAASGISAAMETAPVLQHVWRDAGNVPGNDWRTMHPRLLDLGGGRFCISKTCFVMTCFLMPDEDYDDVDEFFGFGTEVDVLSGVQLLTGADGSIDIVEHKSLGYVPHDDFIRWVI